MMNATFFIYAQFYQNLDKKNFPKMAFPKMANKSLSFGIHINFRKI